jgi:hypothetical protein
VHNRASAAGAPPGAEIMEPMASDLAELVLDRAQSRHRHRRRIVRPIRVEIRDAVEGETLTLSLEGELDLESVPVIRQLDAQISGGKALSLDLSEVTFMIHLACECS